MSPLTKIFVVLLVVLSLLLTAATVTFVNQVENYQANATAAEAKASASESARLEAQNAAAAAVAVAQEEVKARTEQVDQMRQALNAATAKVGERDTQVAAAEARAAQLASDNARLTEALKGSQQIQGTLQTQLASIRGNNDQLQTQNVQLNTTVTDLQNRLDVTERERRSLAEQLAEAKGQSERQAAILRDNGINAAQVAAAGVRGGAPSINGVVRSTRVIAGVPYATISVGANDGVVRGMEFKMINRATGQYLGTLTVDSVEQTEAVGRLSGQRIAEVQPNTEVRTQL